MSHEPVAGRSGPKLTILMPVRNEGVNLRIMLKMLHAVVEVPCEVLIVHDTADDDCLHLLPELPRGQNVRLIHNTLGRGVVNAIKTGVQAAAGEYVLIFAADEIGPVLAIEDMLTLMDEGCQLVSCTRYAHGGRRLGGSFIGGILSRSANRLFHLMAGTVLTDCTTGIKMFRRADFDSLQLESRPVGWAVAFEIAIKAHLLGFSLGEVPVISIDRLYGGKSTFKLPSWTVEYLRWFLWGLVRARQASRRNRTVLVRIPASTAIGGRG